MPKEGPEIPHVDKVAHFGYFFGGAGLLAGGLGIQRRVKTPSSSLWGVFLLVVIVVGVVIGRLDEYHQSFTPERTGNDTGDWLADILGAFGGAWVMLKAVLPALLLRVSKADEVCKNKIE